MSANPDDQRDLRLYLQPIAQRLMRPLQATFHDPSARENEHFAAAAALADFGRQDMELLAQLASEASAEQYELLYAALTAETADRQRATRRLATLVKQQPGEELSEAQRIELGKRRAGAAVTLLRLGEGAAACEIFKVQDDPEGLTQFLHGFKQRGLEPRPLLECLEHATPEQVRFGLLLALGEFRPGQLPEACREPLLTRLVDWHTHNPSSAIHSASGWLLRTWGFQEHAAEVDHTPLPYDPTGKRQWFVQKIGEDCMTFIVFEPREFLIGSPAGEAGRAKDEALRPAAIARPFAICDREVTVGQWQSFQKAAKRDTRIDQDISPGARHPVNQVDWFSAMEYGRWLTESSNAAGKAEASPLRLEFRLPTEAEWEDACRAGVRTAYAFGSDRGLLKYYGWFLDNAERTTHPGGELRPNLPRVFDMHGNVMEWCSDGYAAEAEARGKDTAAQFRLLRGGNWGRDSNPCRCARSQLF